jgi:hypothetical protein
MLRISVEARGRGPSPSQDDRAAEGRLLDKATSSRSNSFKGMSAAHFSHLKISFEPTPQADRRDGIIVAIAPKSRSLYWPARSLIGL